jgi:hypothetical protein
MIVRRLLGLGVVPIEMNPEGYSGRVPSASVVLGTAGCLFIITGTRELGSASTASRTSGRCLEERRRRLLEGEVGVSDPVRQTPRQSARRYGPRPRARLKPHSGDRWTVWPNCGGIPDHGGPVALAEPYRARVSAAFKRRRFGGCRQR